MRSAQGHLKQGILKGGSTTVPLTSCLTGLESAVWQLTIFVFYLQNRLIQTSQTGGQWYSDTSPFSIPCLKAKQVCLVCYHLASIYLLMQLLAKQCPL
jgi:hypothetical protein